MLAGTVPWTYWMVLPLFAAAVVLMVGVLVGSYRKILVPTYEWLVHQLSTEQVQASLPALRLIEGGGTQAQRQRTQLRRAA